MKLRQKNKFNKTKLRNKSKRCGTLSTICIVLLVLLVIFYIVVASYLIPPSKKNQYNTYYNDQGNDHNHNSNDNNHLSIPKNVKVPEIELNPGFQIPKVPMPKERKENQKYVPPNNNHDDDNMEVGDNDDDDDDDYFDICPEKYPKEVPKINEFKIICTHLNDFDIRRGPKCTPENCEECVPPTSKRLSLENQQTSLWQKQFKEEKEHRRNKLKQQIGHLVPKKDGPIILMVFNYGYAWLFYNFLCSIEYNELFDELINRTIIVTTDMESKHLVDTATNGLFHTHYPEWLGDKILGKITSKAAASFALGAHKWIVSIQIALITDLIQMGYDVIMQDIDMIWYKSPIPYLNKPRFRYLDIQMSVDGTMGLRGPGNSGFFIIRSNCKTKLFMKTMISLIGLIMTGRSDQMLWNTLLKEKLFRQVNFQTLTTQYFISGFQVNIAHKTKRDNLPNPDKHFIVHASWTTDQWDKIEKFYNIDHWYFTEEKCPKHYDFNQLPDLAERKWHIRDKTQEQEQKFKKLGLFRDTTNGSYEKHS